MKSALEICMQYLLTIIALLLLVTAGLCILFNVAGVDRLSRTAFIFNNLYRLCMQTSPYNYYFVITVAAQEGPGTVIASPGQDVELLCTVTVTSDTQAAAWLMNKTVGPYRISAIRNGSLAGHTANQDSNNLIVKKIMMNDNRNGSEYRCVIVPAHGTITLANITEESNTTILYVAGEY